VDCSSRYLPFRSDCSSIPSSVVPLPSPPCLQFSTCPLPWRRTPQTPPPPPPLPPVISPSVKTSPSLDYSRFGLWGRTFAERMPARVAPAWACLRSVVTGRLHVLCDIRARAAHTEPDRHPVVVERACASNAIAPGKPATRNQGRSIWDLPGLKLKNCDGVLREWQYEEFSRGLAQCQCVRVVRHKPVRRDSAASPKSSFPDFIGARYQSRSKVSFAQRCGRLKFPFDDQGKCAKHVARQIFSLVVDRINYCHWSLRSQRNAHPHGGGPFSSFPRASSRRVRLTLLVPRPSSSPVADVYFIFPKKTTIRNAPPMP